MNVEEQRRLHEARIEEARKRSNFRPLVYICSPYAGDTERNMENARTYSRFALVQHTIPVTPHLLYPQFLSEETERELALFIGTVLLGKCEEIWVFGGRVSSGMAAEIKHARKWHKPIRWFNAELEEVEEYA